MKQFAIFVVALMATLFVGCTNNDFDPNNPPKMELDTYELNVDGGGGDIPIFYAVRNAIKGAQPEVISTANWVKIKEITSSTIVLSIAPSDINEERFASVTIKYQGMEPDLRVSILQDKQLLNKFRFECTDLTYNSCTVKYFPTDKSIPYMANIIDAEYFKQTGTTDMNVFIEAEMNNYRSIAERNQMTLEELMGRVSPQLIYTGDAERSFAGMKHGSQYVVYSYGVTFKGNEYSLLTPMHQTMVEIPMPEMLDASFGITSQISGTMANITITPKNWDGYYNVQIAPDYSMYYITPGSNPSEGLFKSLASYFYDNARKAMANGTSVEQFLKANCYKGNKQINVTLEADRKYMVYVFAVASEDGAIPVMRSTPNYAYL
ncbi:MAG: BACON domain-containing protein [Alistipes sp.]|nr:BACON domain-containing protein [Alistipes sp.]